VEKTLFMSPEFFQSEKNAGIFLYAEKVKGEEEMLEEEATAAPYDVEEADQVEEYPQEGLLEIGTVGEIEAFVELQEVEEAEEPVEVEAEAPVAQAAEMPPMQELEKERAEKAKREKAPKKKKQRMKLEEERVPRKRKGEKKFIEERIELEEFELEALFAVKADTKAKPKRTPEAPKKEVPPKERKEEFKHVPSEEPMHGIFGDMLKSALEKKKDEKKDDKKSTKKPTKKPGKKK
jgi:hypothetical protein